MNFQQLRFAVAVADTGSFTKAADLCCVTQPALSNAINQLEDELGGQLFTRTTRSVTLSKFGEKLLVEMRGIGDARTRLYRQASDLLAHDEKIIRIGVSPLVSDDFVTTLMSRVKIADEQISIVLTEMNKGDIGPGLDAGLIDFGLVPSPSPGDDNVSHRVYSEPLLYLSGVKPNEPGAPVGIDALADQTMLMVDDGCGLAMVVRRLFMENQIALKEYEGRALSYHILEKWIQLGIGSTLLPASKVQHLEYARRLTDRSNKLISLDFHAIWKPTQEARPNFASVMTGLEAVPAEAAV